MKHVIAIVALLFSAGSASTSPKLCDEAVVLSPDGSPVQDSQGTTLSLYCQWSGPDVPVWNDEVCCSIDAAGAQCESSSPTRDCSTGLAPYFCEYGELIGDEVVCYQPFPSACDEGWCAGGMDKAPPEDPQEDAICCFNGNCYPWDDKNILDCEGQYLWCDRGYSKVDGTVECYD